MPPPIVRLTIMIPKVVIYIAAKTNRLGYPDKCNSV
jgi:hypothetical protein